MDLDELVTTNDEDYFHVALELAQNPEKLAAIKAKIQIQKQTSPLFDTQKFARDLERLYQTIWEQELRGERKAVVLKSEESLNIGEELKNVELRKSFEGCPLCNNVNTKAIIHADVKNHSLYNDFLPSDLTWLECIKCKHVFSQHYWTADGLTQIFKNAHSNQVAGGNSDQKRQTWKPVVQNVLTVMGGFSVLQHMSQKPTWIDIGCGDGGLVMTAAEFGFKAIGLDARMQTVQALIDSGYQSICGDFMQINIDGEPPYIISMMDVLEHLPNPCEALQRAHSLLHPKGVLVISLPNTDCSSWKLMGNSNPYWIEIEHYHNFSRQRLTDLLNQYGFSVVHYDIPFRYKAQMELYAVKK
jgi:SAM-dependent methyltransferase